MKTYRLVTNEDAAAGRHDRGRIIDLPDDADPFTLLADGHILVHLKTPLESQRMREEIEDGRERLAAEARRQAWEEEKARGQTALREAFVGRLSEMNLLAEENAAS